MTSRARNLARLVVSGTGAIDATNLTNAVPADGSITEAKLAASAVTTPKIADGAVVTADIADNAVTTAKIANANVTIAKLSATGTPSASNFLRGDGSWQAVSGGVTSLNGASGAITNTDALSIGSYAMAAKTTSGTASTTIGETISGASLIRSNRQPMQSDDVSNFTSLGASGTWRAMAATPSGQSLFADSVYRMPTLWVRIS